MEETKVTNNSQSAKMVKKPFDRNAKKPFDKNFKRPFDKNRPRRGPVKPVSNLFSKVLEVNRVGATNAGGKVISYSVFCVVGDEKGSVGLGLGKAKEVSSAVDKAKVLAKKNMITLPLPHLETIPHNAETKYRGTRVILRKGNKGHIASNLAKNIFKAAGLKNMVSKALGARSIKNTAYGIFNCLQKIESVGMIASRRNMKLQELINRKKNVISYGLMRQNKTKKN